MTAYVPVRCHACGWRGWRRPLVHDATSGLRDIHGELTDDELDRLDPDER